MRALVRGLIVANSTCVQDIPIDRWYGSRRITDIPVRPFAVIKFGGRFGGIGLVTRRRLEVWVHSDEGDYTFIEDALRHVKRVLDGAEHKKDADGNELISCKWINDSTDLYDDGYRTNTMMSAYDVVGKELT